MYFFDEGERLFWTWDTEALMRRKFVDIVEGMGLGGVMAWSLGEDSGGVGAFGGYGGVCWEDGIDCA